MGIIKRLYVEKKHGHDIEARKLYEDISSSLCVPALTGVRVLNRYDIEYDGELDLELCKTTVFSDPALDHVYEGEPVLSESDRMFAYKYLPGQYDQRADSAMQCVRIATGYSAVIETARVIICTGGLTRDEIERIKAYIINPVDQAETSFDMPKSLGTAHAAPEKITAVDGFIETDAARAEEMRREYGLAMSADDLMHCVVYFRDIEHRNPTWTELRVLDTYWSDHCRHTTFLTGIDGVTFDDGYYSKLISEAYNQYLSAREEVYGVQQSRTRDITLMDIAVMGAKLLKKRGLLTALDESEEINACSINVKVNTPNGDEDWLLMFKNETHNHPTEIEPFGGAATCLGGAIRDPLSGRAYVYQAMRVTGSADPRRSVSETPTGKLPQRKITTGAAHGFSSYGNQIGLATGQVTEIYHPGFMAKRMELGAVLAAAPKAAVRRERPEPGDIVILVGGRTGRDGCGGATGSSKAHTEGSIGSCGAEVQKGNPPTERKLQRLFRRRDAAALIKRCNDFGAGGVSVAIGELAEGLEIDLDKVPKKYAGLDGTELAISESQERMAVVVSAGDAESFISLALEENLEATAVAHITYDKRLVMLYGGERIVDISRSFIDTNGARHSANVSVIGGDRLEPYPDTGNGGLLSVLSDLNICSQKGLCEMFDSTIGSGTVLMPFGGRFGLTAPQAMVAKLPAADCRSNTVSIMAFGYDPFLSERSPFHGAACAVVESLAKLVAVGGSLSGCYLSFQEYFERLEDDPLKWQKPFSALLGAFFVQTGLGIASIGGKDSMSGSFGDINVPPSLISFAVNTAVLGDIISPELKRSGNTLVLLNTPYDSADLPDLSVFIKNCDALNGMIKNGTVVSAYSPGIGGIGAALAKMAFGNKIGFDITTPEPYAERYGSFLLEIPDWHSVSGGLPAALDYEVLGTTTDGNIVINGIAYDMEEAIAAWTEPLEGIYPTQRTTPDAADNLSLYAIKPLYVRPRVFIPVFPGTNCEDDMRRRFEEAGGETEVFVLRNLDMRMFNESVKEMAKSVGRSQIIAIPGGFSAGDEPDGSAKFIAAVFRNPYLYEAVSELLNIRDGLILGICNGFQALMKLGLLTGAGGDNAPTLSYNTIGRHVSTFVRTRIESNKSPWLRNVNVGDIHMIPVSHGEGRFIISAEDAERLAKNGQIATRYVGFNPNGSDFAIEGITSQNGRVFGKMGHSERIGYGLYKNIYDADFRINTDQKLFVSGIEYFK